MYSTRDDPNGTVISTRVEAVDSTGATLVVSVGDTGLRRAEIEGQVDRFIQNPSLLADLSRAHHRLHPDEPRYQKVRIVVARYQLQDSRPSGEVTEQVLATWTRR